jgi:ribose 5-phosphate isomerase A
VSQVASASAPEASASAALEFVEADQTIGLGTGRAAEAFVRALATRVAQGLSVRGVPTSERTAQLAAGLGIPLLTLDEAGRLDVTFDGADEVDSHLDLIKGYGGALVREKIVAASSDRLVILVGEEKLVSKLGDRGKLPIEVVPFGASLARERLRALGCEPETRVDADGRPYTTDNGNHIFDCRVGPIDRPDELDRTITLIPGVLGTGLFVGLTDAVVIQRGAEVEVRRRGA